MSSKLKIKIIKKKNLKSHNKMSFVVEKNKPQNAKREKISRVSEWIDEFQPLCREKTKQTFEQLVAKTLLPAPSPH